MPFKTRIVQVDADSPESSAIALAAEILRDGGLVAFPTETVYGLGAIATSDDAVSGIFRVKGRPAFNPLIVHVADEAMARECAADWPMLAQNAVDLFWPGPLTLVLPRNEKISRLAAAGGPTVAVRSPANAVALRLIASTGLPIAAPSANRSNHVSPTLATHVLDDLDGLIDLVIDAGPCSIGLESTVLDLSRAVPVVLRPGSIASERLSQALGVEIADGSPAPAFASPGLLPIHYAPTVPAFRVESIEELLSIPWLDRATVFLFEPSVVDLPEGVRVIRFSTPEEAGRLLYARLRECEKDGSRWILAVLPDKDSPDWRALRDRLSKATKPTPLTFPETAT